MLNDGEARMLTEEINLVRAGRTVLELGPKFVIIKKGEHGALFLSRERDVRHARLPAGRTSSTPPAPATASPAA